MKRSISILITIALLFTGAAVFPGEVHGATVYQRVTKYHLDLGALHIWGTGPSKTDPSTVWQNGYAYGKTIDAVTPTLSFPAEISNVKAYLLTDSNFRWGEAGYSFNETKYLKDKDTYNEYYGKYASVAVSNIVPAAVGTNGVKISYRANLSSTFDFDLKKELNGNKLEYVLDLLGGRGNVSATYPELYARLLEGDEKGIAANVWGYMIFVPIVIQYDVYEAVEVPDGDFAPNLDLPAMAKQGERYSVSDATMADDSVIIDHAVLEKHYGDGRWQHVADFPGPGRPGENTGGSVNESGDQVCTIAYRLTVWDETGREKSVVKYISITDGREIDGTAILALPEYTYEGHPALAEDLSVFTVDGISYSARRAYEERVADNGFYPIPSSSGSASKKDKTTADVVFPKRGHYNVKLSVALATGGILTDIKPIEVRKTPYIVDHLGGFQKENRKQILDLQVATYPGKPIVDYTVSLKDLATGQEITLTKDQPQKNNGNIKTRAITSGGDSYWTNFELLFLTKNGSEQEFQYTVTMKDSKGDTDTVQKVFTVRPDLPPDPVIVIQDTFIRNKGTNVVEIITEEASTTDGDQLERTWSAGGVNVKTLDGYRDLAFGAGQKVKFNKTGVGKTAVNLHLRDVWIEPTLEEYVTEADRKTAEAEKVTDVINIAPTVRLEPKPSKEADLVIVTDKAHKTELGAAINTLKAALLEKGLDPHISLAVAADAEEGPYRKVASWRWDVTINCPICRNSSGQMDSDYVYRFLSPGKYVDGYQERCKTDQPHVLEALSAGHSSDSGYAAWSYPVNESRNAILYLDDQEKYVYLACQDTNQTTILNRDNGAYLTTLPIAIPGKPFLSSDAQRLYFVSASEIKKYDIASGTLSTALSRSGSLARLMDGKLVFVGKKETTVKQNKQGVGFYLGTFDLDTERVEEIAFPELPGTTGVVSPVDLDSSGKVLLKQENNIWVVDTRAQTVKMTDTAAARNGSRENCSESIAFVKDEKEEGAYVSHLFLKERLQGNGNYTGNVSVYDFTGQGQLTVKASSPLNNSGTARYLSYAKLHSDENRIYIMVGNQVQGSDWSGTVRGLLLRIALPSFSVDTAKESWGWDDLDENGIYAGSLMRTFSAGDQWSGMTHRVNLFRNSLSELDAKTFALRKHGSAGGGDAENYVIVAGGEEAEQLLQDQGFQDEIGLRGARGLFYNIRDSVSVIADRIGELSASLKRFLLLEGDSFSNPASVYHDIQLQPDMDYEYEYKMTATTGKAVDVFGIINPGSKGREQDGKYFEKTVAFINFNQGTTEPFFRMAGGGIYADDYGRVGGYGNYAERNLTFSFSAAFAMKKEGYVEFDMFLGSSGYKDFSNTVTMYLNGKLIGSDGVGGYNTKLAAKKIYLDPGTYTLRFDHFSQATVSGAFASINNLKAVYLEDTAEGFTPAAAADVQGREQTVTGAFRVAGLESVEVLKEQTAALVTHSGIEYDKYISSSYYYQIRRIVGYDGPRPIYDYQYYSGVAFSFDEAAGTYRYQPPYNESGVDMTFRITAPPDKVLLCSYTMGFDGGRVQNYSEAGVERLYPESGILILRPGATHTVSARLYASTYGPTPKVSVSNIRIAELSAEEFGGTDAVNSILFHVPNQTMLTPSGQEYLIARLDLTTNRVAIQHLRDLDPTEAPINSGISLSTWEAASKLSALISEFRLYQRLGGVRQLLLSQDFGSQQVLDLTGWKTTVEGVGKAEIIAAEVPEKEEEAPLVYKKGQLVAYNIFYDDYEADPSKKQYWRYTHTPYNDGPHPEAAFILDEDGGVISSTGAILSQSIPRFYIDGKYTVEHWQEDNTNRTGAGGESDEGSGGVPGGNSGATDYTKYDKVSNVESLTFYVEGGASTPWITSIRTIPGTVKEGSQYRLQIGVDDLEKDELRLTTELYKDKRLIYTHKESGLIADAAGNYPLTTTDYPPLAEGGRYEVVCTVRDWSGAGLGAYAFTVVSEGKITGWVNHTEQWDQNRKKYNLKRFSQECNRPLLLSDYLAMPEPRMRGTNVFWSGERFLLQGETEGSPLRVEVVLQSMDRQGSWKNTGYSTVLTDTGRKTPAGEGIWEGSLWDRGMINKWGRRNPEPLRFVFTAYYIGGRIKTHEATVIIDSRQDYWQLHRLW